MAAKTLPLELRVLAGPQTGASLALKSSSSVDVGSLGASGCQVVLRDPRVSEQRVRLHVGQGDVRIEVLAGSVDMAGQRLVAPCVVSWSHFVPVQIGDTILAVGNTDEAPRWSQALNLALAPPLSLPLTDPFAGLKNQPAADTVAMPTSPKRRPETWLALGGGLITLGAFGLLAFTSMATPALGGASEPGQQRIERVLQQTPEFRALKVEAKPGDRLRISGDLLASADRARLERSVAEAKADAAIDVRVGEEVNAAVQEVYRMNGIPAKTLPPLAIADVGSVQVRTQALDLDRLHQVEASVRRDVVGLTLLQAENTLPQVVPEPTNMVDDPGKRVASIVTGVTPYVVTADGTRYFVGALLPSGHRLAAITEQQVMLDKDGKLSPLKF
jgi:type III secretion protein D